MRLPLLYAVHGLTSFFSRTSFLFLHNYLHSLLLFYRTDHLSSYIHLGFSANEHCLVRAPGLHLYIQRHFLYFSLNLNLLYSPLIPGPLRVFALLLSVRSLNTNLEPSQETVVAVRCCGSPQHLCPLKTPFKDPCLFAIFESTPVSTRA